jgi:hypothetical protein
MDFVTGGKASSLDHNLPDHFDHQMSELSTYNLVKYLDNNLTGQMWSRRPAFAHINYFY